MDVPELTRDEFDRNMPVASRAITIVEFRRPVSTVNPADCLKRGYDLHGKVNRLLGVYGGRKLLHCLTGGYWAKHILNTLRIVDMPPTGWICISEEEFSQLLDDTQWPASSERYANYAAERLAWYDKNHLNDGRTPDSQAGYYALFIGDREVLWVPQEGRITVRSFDTPEQLLDYWLSVGGDDWKPDRFLGMEGGYTP